jgi:hypothetical protein
MACGSDLLLRFLKPFLKMSVNFSISTYRAGKAASFIKYHKPILSVFCVLCG